MDKAQFKAILESTFIEIKGLTTTKGEEYANSDNQLANFHRLADRLGIKAEAIILVFLAKHMDAIDHFVRTGKKHSEPIQGRIDDAILYLLLLKAQIKETSAMN